MTEREKRLLAHILWMEKVIYEKEQAFEEIFGGESCLTIFDVENDSWRGLRKALGIDRCDDRFGDAIYDYITGEISLELALALIDEVITNG
jgi:hypothetical protein